MRSGRSEKNNVVAPIPSSVSLLVGLSNVMALAV
jgi:hypothetical protein